MAISGDRRIKCAHYIVGVDYMKVRGISLDFFRKHFVLIEMRILVKLSHHPFIFLWWKLVLVKVTNLVKFLLIVEGAYKCRLAWH